MATWFLSECGLKPLPLLFPRPTAGAVSRTSSLKLRFLHTGKISSSADLRLPVVKFSGGCFRERSWGIKVSVPCRFQSIEGEEGRTDGVFGIEGEEEVEFDPGAPPSFKLADVRASIPKHCWVKDPVKSMSYVVRDVAVVFGLAAAAAYLNNWIVWPLYWAAQGTMFWALFVLGHDW